MNDNMITIRNVSKQYVLGQIGGTTLREELQRKRAKRLGQEDPTRKIGARNYEDGDTFFALDDVSFDVKKGERVGLIGHNGAGKSTLLKLISRVTAPSAGGIGLNGRVASMLEVGTGFHRELTGRENIYMNGAILGMTKKEIDSKIDQIIEFSECRQFIDTPVKRYSSGMFVKLAFSVAAHLDAEIMIMDEVLAVGDMAFQEKCLNKMNEVSREEGRTILYVSHNMNTIRKLCERCVVLAEGRKIFDGDRENGIKIYMGSDEAIHDTDVDLSQVKHHKDAEHSDIRMTHYRLLEKDMPIFYDDEELSMEIDFEHDRPINDMFFKVFILSESGEAVGTAWSKQFDLAGSGSRKAQIRFPLHSLVKGSFGVSIGFCQRRRDGRNDTLDMIWGIAKIEVQQRPSSKTLLWYPQHWGIKLPDPDFRLMV